MTKFKLHAFKEPFSQLKIKLKHTDLSRPLSLSWGRWIEVSNYKFNYYTLAPSPVSAAAHSRGIASALSPAVVCTAPLSASRNGRHSGSKGPQGPAARWASRPVVAARMAWRQEGL